MGDKTMNFTKSVAIGAFLATTLIAGTAFAKGHNQANTEVPGADVGQETVKASVNEGADQRDENAPVKDQRAPQGMSGSAGR
jgi:hypothetical protein